MQRQLRTWAAAACDTSQAAMVIALVGSAAFWPLPLTAAVLASTQPGDGNPKPPFRIHVVSPLYQNVAKAIIKITSGVKSETVLTDPDGTANLANFPPGNYDIRIAAAGFKTWTQNKDIIPDQPYPLLVTMQPGVLGCEPHYETIYRSEPGPRVQGKVVDSASGHGLGGIKLEWRRPGEKNPMLIVRSKKKGFFEIPGLPPGRYQLRIAGGDVSLIDLNHRDLTLDVVVPAQDTLFITLNVSLRGYIEICL